MQILVLKTGLLFIFQLKLKEALTDSLLNIRSHLAYTTMYDNIYYNDDFDNGKINNMHCEMVLCK